MAVKASDLKPGDPIAFRTAAGMRYGKVTRNRVSATVRVRRNGSLEGEFKDGVPAQLVEWIEDDGAIGGDHVHPDAIVRA